MQRELDDFSITTDFINICRFCLSSDNYLKSIFDVFENGINIIELTGVCIGVAIDINDGYPQFICRSCVKQLIASNEFRNQCLWSLENLRKIKESYKTEEDSMDHTSYSNNDTHLMNWDITQNVSGTFDIVSKTGTNTADELIIYTTEKLVMPDEITNSPSELSEISYSITNLDTESDKLHEVEAISKITPVKDSSVKVFYAKKPEKQEEAMQCPYCDEKRLDIKKHVQRVHPNITKEEFFKKIKEVVPQNTMLGAKECHICGVMRVDLVRHIRRTHPTNDIERKNDDFDSSEQDNVVTVETHQIAAQQVICALCNTIQDDIENHLKEVHIKRNPTLPPIKPKNIPISDRCPLCNTFVEDITNHLKAFHTKPTKNKSYHPVPSEFTVRAERRGKHVKTVCHICGCETFRINTHLKSHNIDNVEFICDYCKKSFKTKATLMAHFKIHLNLREYKCAYCPMAYNVQSTLQVHMLNHTKAQQHPCTYCDKVYTRSFHLSKHIKTTHKRNYNLECRHCDKVFCHQSYRRSHEALHFRKIYTCKVCSKTYNSPSSYFFHIQQHSKENPHKCDICNETFVRLRDFNTHKRKHKYLLI